MALEVSAQRAAQIAIASIGCGYDLTRDLRLKYCIEDGKDIPLIEFDDAVGCYDVSLPDGISIPNVSKLIKCTNLSIFECSSDFLSFEQMSKQFNHEMLHSDNGIPSGFFNSMFDFSGCTQKDKANAMSLAFDGRYLPLYRVSVEKSQFVLHDHVKKAVPSLWEPAAIARFIQTFGTHIIVGVTMGGKDVLYVKQRRSSSFVSSVFARMEMRKIANKKFSENNGRNRIDSEQVELNNEGISIIHKRRGGKEEMTLSHSEWLLTVQDQPEVLSMSFIPITSLLNGMNGSGFLSRAIGLYLKYKPTLEELHMFLEFQLPRNWAPDFDDHPLPSRQKRQIDSFLQFKLLGPKLFVNTIQVDVGKRPVTGLRLYLEGQESNRLAVYVQHLSSLPNCFRLVDDPHPHTFSQESYDKSCFREIEWKNYSRVCTAPVESDNEHSIVTGAQLQVEKYGLKNVLFLRLCFSTVSGAVIRHSEWDESFEFKPLHGSFKFAPHSGVLQRFVRWCLKPKPPQSEPVTEKNSHTTTSSALYNGGPRVPNYAPKLLKFVYTGEMTRGPEDPPGYWVVSGARLVVEKGMIALRLKYSLLQTVI